MRSLKNVDNVWYVVYHRNGKEFIVGKYDTYQLACEAAWPKY